VGKILITIKSTKYWCCQSNTYSKF